MARKVYLGTNLINDTYLGLDKTNLPSTRIVLASYVVAAGGGGGGCAGGGGGAGEVATNYLTGSTFPLIAANYTVTVGEGGLGGAYYSGSSKPIVDNLNLGSGSNGYSSSIVSNLNAIYAEGGGGASGYYSASAFQPTGSDGGSGGGSWGLAPGGTSTATAYGRDGGTSDSVGVPAYTGSYTGSAPNQSKSYKDIPGGGGGVFEATGSWYRSATVNTQVTDNDSHWMWTTFNDGASFSQYGHGGYGDEPLTVDYNPYNSGEVGAGGGGGAGALQNPSFLDRGFGGGNTGGNGGGLDYATLGGAYAPSETGSAYSGAGGGGGAFRFFFGNPFYYDGADGGSGIVVIKYELPQKYEGGELYYSGSDVMHVFTASGELTSII